MTLDKTPTRVAVPLAAPVLVAGGGNMGALIRAHDWSATPLGPPESWPQALRSTLDICLHSSFPTAIYWGPELRLLYNDAWASVPAEKHPWALGRTAREVWADIWHVIEPQFKQVFATGQGFSTFDQLLPLKRGGRIEETYWSYSFTPIRGEDGCVVGIFNQGHETTAKVIAARERQAEVEHLRELFQQAPSAVALLRGPDHVFEIANPAYLQLIGDRDVLGKPLAKALPELVEQGFIELLNEVYRTSEAHVGHSVPVRFQRTPERPPENRVLDFVCQPIRDATATITGIFVQATDVTERGRAEQALREETRGLETLNRIGKVVAAELDHERAVQVVTDAATELSGAAFGAFFHNERDPSGRGFALYTLSGASRDAFAKFPLVRPTALLGATLERGNIVRADDIMADPRYGRNAPGRGMPPGHLPVRSYLAVPVVSRSGVVLGGLLFGHPEPGVFTERIERLVAGIASQAAIALDNARLYQEAQQEITRREQTEEALREADRRKDEFLATLSHELRNPLAPIRQAVALFRTPGATPEQLQWSRDVIERQVGHMAHLLDDLLDISRITRGRLNLRKEQVELSAVIEAAIETARPLIDARRHKLAVEIPTERVYFNADRIRVVQIVSNLLTNAAKYTDAGGRIDMRSQLLDQQVLIAVRDTGIGIAPEMMPRLFEMFSQVESTLDRAEGGLGIGLALVRGLVDLHGGTVEAESAGLGQGSEFIVRLPLCLAASPSTTDTSDADVDAMSGASGLKILVADDNADSAESLAMLLRLMGHEVKTAYSGRDAFDVASTFRPRVALLDIGMPELNGYQTAERIRAHVWGQQMTLIAISGWGQEEDKHRAILAGFDRHLTKPVDPEAVAALLSELPRRA